MTVKTDGKENSIEVSRNAVAQKLLTLQQRVIRRFQGIFSSYQCAENCAKIPKNKISSSKKSAFPLSLTGRSASMSSLSSLIS